MPSGRRDVPPVVPVGLRRKPRSELRLNKPLKRPAALKTKPGGNGAGNKKRRKKRAGRKRRRLVEQSDGRSVHEKRQSAALPSRKKPSVPSAEDGALRLMLPRQKPKPAVPPDITSAAAATSLKIHPVRTKKTDAVAGKPAARPRKEWDERNGSLDASSTEAMTTSTRGRHEKTLAGPGRTRAHHRGSRSTLTPRHRPKTATIS
jgi:hypothetical protein